MIDKTKIENEFSSKLKDQLEPAINNRVKSLSASKRQEFIETVKKYYGYLADNGIAYGKLALEVVNNRGRYGLMANFHLKHQCAFDGIKAEKIPKVREQLIISLAYHDMKMRQSNQNNQGNYDFAREIEEYHISVFQSLATVYAWGGLAFRELVGTGSWLKLYERGGSDLDALALFKNYKRSNNYSSARLLDSLRHTWTHYHSGFIVNVSFRPHADAVSKEYLAKSYDVPESRILEADAPQPEMPMVAYKHYEILAASDHPINHENTTTTSEPLQPQVSSEMQALIASYKLTNVTSNNYRAEYKGRLTHYVPIDYTYIAPDPTAMNQTIRFILNIHHSSNKANNDTTKDGFFYISLVSPQKTMFYRHNIEMNNNYTTKDIHTKSIALSGGQHDSAAKWANLQSRVNQKDSNVAFINDDVDGRNFVQNLWHYLDKPLYFTVLYTTDELMKLGTKCASDLLNVYGSFDTMKRGWFMDKDLSRELLADRLNINVANVVANDTATETNSQLKSFTVRVDEQLIDRARAMIIDVSSYTAEQCRIVTKHENVVVQSEAALAAIGQQRNTSVVKFVDSVLQQYQWDLKDSTVESIMCLDDMRELRNEYNQRQPSMFLARREVVVNSFGNSSPAAKNLSFVDYLLNGNGEANSIHRWYVNRILACKYWNAHNDMLAFVNGSIQKWNNLLDLLSTKAQLNISWIAHHDYHTYSLIPGTIFETFKPLHFGDQKTSIFPDNPSKVHYELECTDADNREEKKSGNNENLTDVELHRRARRDVTDTSTINRNREYGKLMGVFLPLGGDTVLCI